MGFGHQAKQRWLNEEFLLSKMKHSEVVSSLIGSVLSSFGILSSSQAEMA
jgi:hypothetical protein